MENRESNNQPTDEKNLLTESESQKASGKLGDPSKIPDRTVQIGKRILRVRHDDDTHTHLFGQSNIQGEMEDVVVSYKNIDMDKLIEFVGSEGVYQWSLIIYASAVACILGAVLYAGSF